MIVDILNMLLENKVLDKINIQFSNLLVHKALDIVGSSYKSHNKTAIKFMEQSLKRFSDEIISIKTVPMMSKNDLQRDERL